MSGKWAMLNIKVQDGVTKELVAARVHIKQPGGSCYLPPVGVGEKCTDPHVPGVILPSHFRKNLHLCRDADIQSAHLANGEASFPVPAGKLTIYVSRGHEKVPARRTVVAKSGKTAHLDVELQPSESMSGKGWYLGDMHVHFSRFKPEDDFILARLMAAEDLSAVNNMVYKHEGKIEAPQRTMGHQGTHYELQHGHQVVAGGEEFRDDDMYGHMIAAGISSVIEPISVGEKLGRRENYPLFAQVCDWTHDQGGIAGWAHGGAIIKLFESLPVEAALRKLDFVESVQFNSFCGFYFWYRLLNCGLKLAATGGSDFPFGSDTLAPWYPSLGLDRTYVNIGGKRRFSYDAYIDGIRHGRTFATNGPLLMFEVNGRGPGESINMAGHQEEARLFARAVCSYPLDRMEIVVNGAVQHAVEGNGGQRELTCETRVRLRESSWLAARVRGRVEPQAYGGVAPWNLHAHSSPIYVIKDGTPIVQRADATWMADYIRYIGEIYRKGGRFSSRRRREALLQNLGKALAFYEGLLKE